MERVEALVAPEAACSVIAGKVGGRARKECIKEARKLLLEEARRLRLEATRLKEEAEIETARWRGRGGP